MRYRSCLFGLQLLVGIALSAADELLEEQLNQEIARLFTDLELHYFHECRCIALITDSPAEWLTYQKTVDRVPHFHVLLHSEATMHDQLVSAVDAQCPVIVFQVAEPKSITQLFQKVKKFGARRGPMKFIYLPVLKRLSGTYDKESKVEELFALRAMDFMPDVLYIRAKIWNQVERADSKTFPQMNTPVLSVGPDAERKLYCNDTETDITNIDTWNDSFLNICNCPQGRTYFPLQRQSSGNVTLIEFQLLTNQFKGPKPSQVIFLGSWTAACGFLLYKELFMNKLDNLQEKEFMIAGMNYPPYVVFNLTDPPEVDGAELQCLKMFLNKLNASMKYMDDQGMYWGVMNENGSGSGLIGFVVDDVADFAVSGMYFFSSVIRYADYSTPYARGDATLLVPKPKPLSRLLTPFRPFPLSVWLIVGASFFISFVLLFVMAKLTSKLTGNVDSSVETYTSLSGNFLNVLGILVGQAPSEPIGNAPLRHLLAWTVIFYLMVSTLYNSGLAANLTLPAYEAPIDSPEDFINTPFLWAANSEVWVVAMRTSTDDVNLKMVDKFRVLPDEELTEMAKAGTGAFILERTSSGTFVIAEHVTLEFMEDLRQMKGKLYWNFMGIPMRKGSPYNKMFNIFIERVVQAGIYDFLERYITKTKMSQNLQLAVSTSILPPSAEPVKLTLGHVQGMFLILGAGIILATMAFVAEIYSVKTPHPNRTVSILSSK